jgi:chromosome segregation ATPase
VSALESHINTLLADNEALRQDLAAARTDLVAATARTTCLKMVLAQVREDRDELRQERDAWRRVAEKLNDCAIREVARLAFPERSSWRRFSF